MLWNQKVLVVSIVVVAAVIGFGLSLLQTETYEATAAVLITDPNTAQELTDQMGLERSAARNLANQAVAMESIDSSISATPKRETGVIDVRASSSTAPGAVASIDAMFVEYSTTMQAAADTAAAELLAQLDDRKEDLEAEVAQLEAAIIADPNNPTLRTQQGTAINELRSIDRSRSRFENQLETYGSGVQRYEVPVLPNGSSGSSAVRNAIIAAVLGLLIATGVAWVRGADA